MILFIHCLFFIQLFVDLIPYLDLTTYNEDIKRVTGICSILEGSFGQASTASENPTVTFPLVEDAVLGAVDDEVLTDRAHNIPVVWLLVGPTYVGVIIAGGHLIPLFWQF